MPFYAYPNPIKYLSGLSDVACSGSDMWLTNNTFTNRDTIPDRELTIREELQKDIDNWLGDMVK